MAEKQDAVMEALSAQAQDAEGAATPTETPEKESTNGEAASQSSDNMAWVGAVKKDARKKGYDEGYQRAQSELREMLAKPEAAQETPANSISQSTPNPPANGQASNVSPEMAAAMANEAQMTNRFGQIAQMGMIKYPDYQEKMADYVQQAQEREKAGDPELSVLMTMAAKFGNEDLVHKVASDEDFRNKILQSNPKLWANKLLQSNLSPSTSHQGSSPTIKVAAPPTGNLPKTSSYGDLGKISSAEKRARQKKLSRGG